jgi:hypothetical protein
MDIGTRTDGHRHGQAKIRYPARLQACTHSLKPRRWRVSEKFRVCRHMHEHIRTCTLIPTLTLALTPIHIHARTHARTHTHTHRAQLTEQDYVGTRLHGIAHNAPAQISRHEVMEDVWEPYTHVSAAVHTRKEANACTIVCLLIPTSTHPPT